METNIWSYSCSIFEETTIFPQEFLDQCKNNPNEPQLPPSEFKVVLKIMLMGQGLYTQAVMILRKNCDDKKEKEKTNNITSKGNPQVQYSSFILIMHG